MASTLRGVTIKLPEATWRRLKQQARESGRSVAALVRERVEVQDATRRESVYAITADLAGSVTGSRRPAGNERRKFRRS